jgi:hypothetical protein
MQDIQQRLAEPFDASEIHWKPQAVNANRALAIAYIDARSVMDRLDSVVGIGSWQDAYDTLPDGSVVCRLSVRIGEEWVTKVDVGSESDQKDSGDKRKAAFSDALKRAAVKFGIGRYLYNLPSAWVDWDAKAKAFIKVPTLPAWALPARGNGDPGSALLARTARKLPANGKELLTRLNRFEQGLVSQGRCKAGDLVRHVLEAGQRVGHPADLAEWSAGAIQLAVDEAKRFGDEHKAS